MKTFLLFFVTSMILFFSISCSSPSRVKIKCHLINLNADVDMCVDFRVADSFEEGDTVYLFMHEIDEKEWQDGYFKTKDTTIWVENCRPYRGSYERLPGHFVHRAEAIVK